MADTGGVLCLDLAPSVSGWALGQPGARLPEFGRWRLPQIGGEGGRYVAFVNILDATLKRSKPSSIVLEAALALPGQTDMMTCRQQLGLRAFVYEAAARHAIPVCEIDVQTVRMEVMGRAGWPKKGQAKIEVVRFCRELGLDLTDHNAADACMLFLWHRRRLTGLGPVAGPLFRERATAKR